MTFARPPRSWATRQAAGPLGVASFRRIWSTSLLSNLGQQIQIVVVAWGMVELAAPPDQVSLVQAAAMLPVMLLALPAGALADIYDRRMLAIGALLVCTGGAALLFVAALAGALTPTLLLSGCFLSGTGFALLSPSWQSSVKEQVGPDALPAAIALYGVSANLARCVGPAAGGVMIAWIGATPTFAVNAMLYLPMIGALLLWRREQAPTTHPVETVAGAIRTGVRYFARMPALRRIVLRAFLSAVGSVAVLALAPLIASDRLQVDAGAFGLLLAGFGAGGTATVFLIAGTRRWFTPQQTVAACGVGLAVALIALALSRSLTVSIAAMAVAGAAWMMSMAVFNLGVQMSASPWVAGRALAIFSAAVACGMALGASLWGVLAARLGLVGALAAAACLVLLTVLAGALLPLPAEERQPDGLTTSADRELVPDPPSHDGEITLFVEYCVAPQHASDFSGLMRDVALIRERNGAVASRITRAQDDGERWVEWVRYASRTEYARALDRLVASERRRLGEAWAFQVGGHPPQYRWQCAEEEAGART